VRTSLGAAAEEYFLDFNEFYSILRAAACEI